MSDVPVYVPAAVVAVRALWDRSGLLAGPVIREQLSLLHYTAANGVEIRRQVVPANAAEVVAALLDAGADRSAKLHAYEGALMCWRCSRPVHIRTPPV
jgi:hypothetical protein